MVTKLYKNNKGYTRMTREKYESRHEYNNYTNDHDRD